MNSEQILEQARRFSESGKMEHARLCLLELLKQDPDNQTALMMLGGSYFTEHKFSEAEMVFEKLVLLSPGTGRFSIALFNTLWNLERQEEALEEIKRFISVADRDAERETINQYLSIINSIAANDT